MEAAPSGLRFFSSSGKSNLANPLLSESNKNDIELKCDAKSKKQFLFNASYLLSFFGKSNVAYPLLS